MHSKSKQKAKCRNFKDQTESLKIINASLLIKSFGNYSGIETFNTAIRMLFDFIDPFVTNDIFVFGSRGGPKFGWQGECQIQLPWLLSILDAS